ncbi:Neurofilament heavy protein [Heracleum sosnowskyi]|uniref:Neurofilament heavy protein n=1 Tax=Heracleum sosnowskyi TaxID=360622 RepID=A0AAD8M4M6_9APIA|nr:Neurofilament heavy protein [Heracleum sosnowskyi]
MEAAQLSIQKFLKTITEEEEREVQQQQGQVEEQNDEGFYEEIEAPKFVDFTASDDPFRPDDCYWFCLRVGCDRKHEEELDPEEISKNFVLRVMAARSPNVRLRRALNGRNMSSMKCPLSAPVKSSRSRLPRLGMVSSMSQKMLDVKEKVGSHPKINLSSTPMVKGKQVASKYMTTPRNKRNLSHQTSFRSVQNPRPSKIAVPKSRLVAKALVFRSPKKDIPNEAAVELNTPLTKLCEGMKRLEIKSQRKRLLGYTGKMANGTKCTQNTTATESSRKQRTIQDGKCLPLSHRNCKGKEAKSLKTDKSNKQILTEQFEKVSEDGSRKERIDIKSKDGSALDFSVSEGNEHGEALEMTKRSSNTIMDSAGNEINSLSNLDTKVESVLCRAVAAERDEHEKHLKTGVSEKEVLVPSGKNSDLLTGNGIGEICSPPNLEGVDALVEEGIEGSDIMKREDRMKVSSKNDDKENGQAPDKNRAVNCSNNHSKKKLLGRKQTHENDKKVVREVKDGLTATTTAAPDVKNRKPKPTNPKPFRLRTDERGILKEANMEKKLNHPQNQAAVISSFRSGNSQRRRGNDTKENEKCSVQSNGSNNNPESVDKESSKEVQKAAAKLSRTARLQTIREQACKTPQRRINSVPKIPNHATFSQNDINNNENKKPEKCIRKPQSSSPGQLIRSQGRKVMNSSKLRANGLCVIKETLKAKSTGKPYESSVASSTKSTASAAFRSSSRVPNLSHC